MTDLESAPESPNRCFNCKSEATFNLDESFEFHRRGCTNCQYQWVSDSLESLTPGNLRRMVDAFRGEFQREGRTAEDTASVARRRTLLAGEQPGELPHDLVWLLPSYVNALTPVVDHIFRKLLPRARKHREHLKLHPVEWTHVLTLLCVENYLQPKLWAVKVVAIRLDDEDPSINWKLERFAAACFRDLQVHVAALVREADMEPEEKPVPVPSERPIASTASRKSKRRSGFRLHVLHYFFEHPGAETRSVLEWCDLQGHEGPKNWYRGAGDERGLVEIYTESQKKKTRLWKTIDSYMSDVRTEAEKLRLVPK